jgi:hypothetical protein
MYSLFPPMCVTHSTHLILFDSVVKCTDCENLNIYNFLFSSNIYFSFGPNMYTPQHSVFMHPQFITDIMDFWILTTCISVATYKYFGEIAAYIFRN